MSAMRGGPPGFTPEDRLLALALTLFEASLCPDCAQPKDRAHHPDMDGWYELEEDNCYGCAAVESATSGKEIPRSTKLYVVEDPQAPKVLHQVD